MKRCQLQGKRKLRDAGEAVRFIDRGEGMGFYRCPHCKFFHLTKLRRPK